MNKVWAYVVDGRIAEVIQPMFYDAESPDWQEGDPSRIGEEIPIELRYHPDFVAQCVEITGIDPVPQSGWVVTPDGSGWSFAPWTPPPPTAAEILASQSAILVSLKQTAEAQKVALTNRVGTLNDAIELEMATPEEVAELPLRKAQLVEWKRYAVLLGRVTSQAGWPPDVEWPVQPAAGMDLSISARAEESFS